MQTSRTVFAVVLLCGCALEAADGPPVGVVVAAVDTNQIFGTFGQSDYEHTWRETLSYTGTILNRFDSDLDDTDTKDFSWSTDGAKSCFEEGGDTAPDCGVDNVDLLFFAGHGGAWGVAGDPASSLTATHTMWNEQTRAFSHRMRLGDDSRHLAIFSTYCCETHAGGTAPSATNDPSQINGTLYTSRWTKAFDGGLRIATSTVMDAKFGSSYADLGKRYSNNLQAGQLVKNAWANALNIGSSNDPSALATGANSTDCWARMDSITWANVRSKSRLVDQAWQTMCREYWVNI